jgi:hypothetical protein
MFLYNKSLDAFLAKSILNQAIKCDYGKIGYAMLVVIPISFVLFL